MVGCVIPSPRPSGSFAAPECGPKVCPQQPTWAESGQHPCFAAYSHVVDAMLTLDVLLVFDGYESMPPSPMSSVSGDDPYGLLACKSAVGSLSAGDVASVVTWLMQVPQCCWSSLRFYAVSFIMPLPSSLIFLSVTQSCRVFLHRAPRFLTFLACCSRCSV